MAKVWKDADNKFLKENYLKYSNQELADMFEVTKKSIQGKLRRLGLHRKDDTAAETEAVTEDFTEIPVEEIPEEKPVFRRKHLNIEIPVVVPPTPPKAPYQPLELTEKRKRAIREFDNAMNLLSKGDKEKAVAEFEFIKDNFPRELDIIQKSIMWIGVLNRKAPADPVTPEEFYCEGVSLVQKNQYDKALTYFEKTLELDPEYLDAKYNLACIACRKGDFDSAIQQLTDLAEEDERFVDSATRDYDFEPVWENQQFIDMALSYIDIEETD